MGFGSARFLYSHRGRLGERLGSALCRSFNPKRRWHVIPELSLAAFAAKLDERGVGYVALASVAGGEGLELLVADEDLDRLDDLVTRWPVGPPVRLYSVFGRPGFRFRPSRVSGSQYSLSLLPPALAQQSLGRSVGGANGLKVPGPRDAFLVSAYRAAYLEKGCWRFEEVGGEWFATGACEAELRRLAAVARIALAGPVTAAALDRLLEREGWRPSLDLLERTALWMPWIGAALPAEGNDPPGVTVFFLRERAVRAGLKPMLLESLQDSGFEPLLVADIDAAQREQAASAFRGGNWGAGPYRVSGGPPAVIAVCIDLLPVRPNERHRAAYPGSDNAKIIKAKIAARDLVNSALPAGEHYNAVHSTDNSAQAWRVIRQLLPGKEQALRGEIERMRQAFATDGAIREFTRHGRRAKVELIEFEGKLAIRKTFKSTALRYMEREIEVMEGLAPIRPEIPRLLARGDNHIIVEYVGGGAAPPPRRTGRPRPLPLPRVRQIADFIKDSVAHGFDPVDLRADGNVIYTPDGLKLIDFEFWRRCDPTTRPEKSGCLGGVAHGETEKRPQEARRSTEPYRIGWYPYTLLPVESFLYDPAWLQRLKRGVNLVKIYGTWLARRSANHLRQVASRAKRGVRDLVLAPIRGLARRFSAAQRPVEG